MIDFSEKQPWVYYSDLVSGYVEKYTNRGMRKRNDRLLAKLRGCSKPENTEPLRRALVENNLPLAKAIAERYAWFHRLSQAEADDAFQDAVLGLAQFIDEAGKNELSDLGVFTRRICSKMRFAIVQNSVVRIPENQWERVPFDDETDWSTPDDVADVGIHKELVFRLMGHVAPKRNREIVYLYFFGDPDSDSRPLELEEIGYRTDLTRESVRRIIVKTLNKTARYISHLRTSTDARFEDFIYDLDETYTLYDLPELTFRKERLTLPSGYIPPPFR